MDRIGADRPLEDVESEEAERRVEMVPVERDVLAGHEPVVHVPGEVALLAGPDTLDLGNTDEAVEVGDRAASPVPGPNTWNTSVPGPNGWKPPGIGRGLPGSRAAEAGPAEATCAPRTPTAPRPMPASRRRRLMVCRCPGVVGPTVIELPAMVGERAGSIATPPVSEWPCYRAPYARQFVTAGSLGDRIVIAVR